MKNFLWILCLLPLMGQAQFDNGDEFEMNKLRQQMEQDKLNRYSYEEAVKSVEDARTQQRERMAKGQGHLKVSPRQFITVSENSGQSEITTEVASMAEQESTSPQEIKRADGSTMDVLEIFLVVAMFGGIGWLVRKNRRMQAER